MTAHERALRILHSVSHATFSFDTFVAIVRDPQGGKDLRQIVAGIERGIVEDRAEVAAVDAARSASKGNP